jgi:hypothetical protein
MTPSGGEKKDKKDELRLMIKIVIRRRIESKKQFILSKLCKLRDKRRKRLIK